MSPIASMFVSLQRFFASPVRPTRLIYTRRFRLFAAVGAAGTASLVLVALYYLTLGLLPTAFATPVTSYPNPAWAARFDMAQFFGVLVYPPLPNAITWWIGLALFFGTYVGLGLTYAVLLAWAMEVSDVVKGIGVGVAAFVVLGLVISTANGIHPGIMRNTVPDTGLYFLGWAPTATLQFAVLNLLFGGILGGLYRHWSQEPQ